MKPGLIISILLTIFSLKSLVLILSASIIGFKLKDLLYNIATLEETSPKFFSFGNSTENCFLINISRINVLSLSIEYKVFSINSFIFW